MDAKELRIGNNIQDLNDNLLDVVGLIDGVIYSLYPVGLKAENTTTDPTKIKPIEINKEWLLKFGFYVGEDNRVFSFNNYGFDLGITKFFLQLIVDEDVITHNESKKINRQLIWVRTKCKYVHQLQNLYFALENKELNI